MPKSKTICIVATGPIFHPGGLATHRHRTLLLSQREANRATGLYYVATQMLDGTDRPKIVRHLKTRHFTTAVRFFCDFVLDQATEDDRAIDARRMIRRITG